MLPHPAINFAEPVSNDTRGRVGAFPTDPSTTRLVVPSPVLPSTTPTTPPPATTTTTADIHNSLTVLFNTRNTPFKHPAPGPGDICQICQRAETAVSSRKNALHVDIRQSHERSYITILRPVLPEVIEKMKTSTSKIKTTGHAAALRTRPTVEILEKLLHWGPNPDQDGFYMAHSSCHSSLKKWCVLVTGRADLFPDIGGRRVGGGRRGSKKDKAKKAKGKKTQQQQPKKTKAAGAAAAAAQEEDKPCGDNKKRTTTTEAEGSTPCKKVRVTQVIPTTRPRGGSGDSTFSGASSTDVETDGEQKETDDAKSIEHVVAADMPADVLSSIMKDISLSTGLMASLDLECIGSYSVDELEATLIL